MILQDILNKKGTRVFTTDPNTTLEEAVEQLVEHNVGSLLVCESNEEGAAGISGIITERDILRTVASHRGRLNELHVADVMTTALVTVTPRQTIEQAMALMTEHRIRHLPVVVEGQLRGMISIGDIVKTHHNLLEQDNYYMKSYIQGEGGERGTLVRPS